MATENLSSDGASRATTPDDVVPAIRRSAAAPWRRRLRAVGGRLTHLVLVMLLVSIGTFAMLELVPGDPAVAVLGPDATPAQYEEVRQELRLEDSLGERYVRWVSGVLRGDLGESLVPPRQSVSEIIGSALPVTAEIAFLAALMALVAAVPTALLAAYRPGRAFDRVANVLAYAAISLPSFLAGLLFIFVFVLYPDIGRWSALVGVMLGGCFVVRRLWRLHRYPAGRLRRRSLVVASIWAAIVVLAALFVVRWFPSFPRQGFVRLTAGDGLWKNLQGAFLPALTLALTEAGVFMTVLRSDLMTTLQEDFILLARAKGMPVRRILVTDALRSSLFSLITVAGVVFARLLGGTVIVETIFSLPGMGSTLVKAILDKNFTVVQGIVLVIALIYVLFNTIIDALYKVLDPRLRRGGVQRS